MMNRFKLAVLPLVMVFLGLFTSTASAADTWLPKNFDSSTHVYLDPGLANHSRYPVSLNGLEQKLKAASSNHNLQFYFVMVEMGTEPNTSRTGQKFGAWKLDQFVAAIQSKLPADDYVIVMVVRDPNNPNRLSMAGQGGNRLQKYGLNATWFNAANGPLESNRRIYLPNDPVGYANAIAGDVNKGVTDYFANIQRAEEERKAAEERERQRKIAEAEQERQRQIDAERSAKEWAAFKSALPQRILVIGMPIFLLVVSVIVYFWVSGAASRLAKAIKGWEDQFDNANTNYLQLRDSYLGFLKSNGVDWLKRFIGKTLQTYTAAVKQYADLSARIQVAQGLLNEARKAAKTKLFSPLFKLQVSAPVLGGVALAVLAFVAFSWQLALLIGGLVLGGGLLYLAYMATKTLNKGTALLESDAIKITGEELPIEERDFFKSVMQETNYAKPADLLQDMANLFTATNKALASIKGSFDGAEQNRKDIEQITGKIEAGKGRLTQVALTFDPYQKRFDAIKTDTASFMQILTSDPMSAFTQSEEVEKKADDLVAEINRAITIKESLVETEGTVRKAHTRVAEVRAQKADYSYPEKDARPAAGASATTLLNETGSNPDSLLAKADEQLAAAFAAVLAGQLDLSEQEKKAAVATAGEVHTLVETVLAARAHVQKNVVPLRDNLGRLTSDVPGADKALQTLKSDFLAKNFPGEAVKLDNANAVIAKTEGELAKVRLAFFEQRYVAARKLLEGITGDVQGARNRLVEVHTRLAKLNELRQHAKDVVGQTRQLANALRDKLKTNSFTTSAATDDTYTRLIPVLSGQEKDVAKQVTDWPAAAEAADSVLGQFKTVDSKIDEERKANELANQRVNELRNLVSDARHAVDHADTRQQARHRLSDAQEALRDMEAALKVAKSDWASVGRTAEAKKTIAQEAKSMAEKDQQLAHQARTSISSTSDNINSLEIRSWVQTASWGGYSRIISLSGILNLSTARSYLRSAESDLRNRNYEEAIANQQRAQSAADSAEAAANAAVAAAVAEAIAEWQEIERRKEEERRRREEEERRRREEEDRRRREEEDRRRREEEDRQRREDDARRDDGRSGGGVDTGDSGRSGGGAGDF